jgi:enoyl-CoA hydratase
MMWENLDASFAAAIASENRTQILAAMTQDYREATAAFTEKREPRFEGR